MRFHSRLGCLCAGAGVVLAGAVAAEPDADLWSRTVALPTGCYSSQDQFAEQNLAALEALTAEATKQEEINQAIGRKTTDTANVDPMELARRMQEAMMKDPQNAMKYMENAVALGDPAEQARQTERAEEMAAAEKELFERYRAALDAGYAPARARMAALRKKLGIASGGIFDESGGTPEWVGVEFNGLMRAADEGYRGVCSRWFSPTGEMQAFLKRYKDYLVSERVPSQEKVDAQAAAGYAMVGNAAESYRSVATYDAVRDYMELAARLYGQREIEARCTAAECPQNYGTGI
jgi:hypothetical protein